MAVTVLTAAKILVGNFDASGFANEVAFGPISAVLLDAKTFASGGYDTHVLGMTTIPFKFMGLNDYTAGALDATFAGPAFLGQQNAVTVSVPGATAGDPAYIMRGIVNQYQPGMGKIGELNTVSVNVVSDTGPGGGQLAAPLASRTTTGTGTVLTQAGPTATQTLYAAVHATALSGTPTVTVKIQSATTGGFGSPTDRITTWTGTSAGGLTTTGWQWGSVAGPVTDGFWRASWTVAGGTPNMTFAVAIGLSS